MNLKIKGVIVPTVTPFDEFGQLNLNAVQQLVDFLIDRGVAGLFPGGTTGEGPLLTLQERYQLAEAFVKAADGRVPVIVHTGAITTEAAQKLTRHAQAIGAQAAALIPPYYYQYSNQALQRYYETIANQVPDFPIYLYNNPPRAGNSLSSLLILQLIERCPNIIGMKDSSGLMDTLFDALSYRNGAFNTASGNDGQILLGFCLGFDACVSGNANVIPELVVALHLAVNQGNLLLARELQCKLNAVRCILEDGADLSLFKAIMNKRGMDVGCVRPPQLQIAEEIVEQRWQALNALNLNL